MSWRQHGRRTAAMMLARHAHLVAGSSAADNDPDSDSSLLGGLSSHTEDETAEVLSPLHPRRLDFAECTCEVISRRAPSSDDEHEAA